MYKPLLCINFLIITSLKDVCLAKRCIHEKNFKLCDQGIVVRWKMKTQVLISFGSKIYLHWSFLTQII